MKSTKDITAAVIELANEVGVDKALASLEKFASSRQNQNMVSQIKRELDTIARQKSSTKQITISTTGNVSADTIKASMDRFTTDMDAADKAINNKSDDLLAGLIVESGSARLNLSTKYQLQKLARNLTANNT